METASLILSLVSMGSSLFLLYELQSILKSLNTKLSMIALIIMVSCIVFIGLKYQSIFHTGAIPPSIEGSLRGTYNSVLFIGITAFINELLPRN